MITDEDFDHYLVRSSYVWQSVLALRPEYPRFRRRLAERGVTRLAPLGPREERLDSKAAKGHNELNLVLKQARPDRGDKKDEHDLRNLLRDLRGPKP